MRPMSHRRLQVRGASNEGAAQYNLELHFPAASWHAMILAALVLRERTGRRSDNPVAKPDNVMLVADRRYLAECGPSSFDFGIAVARRATPKLADPDQDRCAHGHPVYMSPIVPRAGGVASDRRIPWES